MTAFGALPIQIGEHGAQVVPGLDVVCIQIDGLPKLKVAVVMIGLNNKGITRDEPADIAVGIEAICRRLKAKAPDRREGNKDKAQERWDGWCLCDLSLSF